jgi:hypothetical protein
LLFGLLADLSGGGAVSSQQHVTAANTRGLQYTFLIMLIPLALNGLILLGARRSYPADVAATAVASERHVESSSPEADRRDR